MGKLRLAQPVSQLCPQAGHTGGPAGTRFERSFVSPTSPTSCCGCHATPKSRLRGVVLDKLLLQRELEHAHTCSPIRESFLKPSWTWLAMTSVQSLELEELAALTSVYKTHRKPKVRVQSVLSCHTNSPLQKGNRNVFALHCSRGCSIVSVRSTFHLDRTFQKYLCYNQTCKMGLPCNEILLPRNDIIIKKITTTC